MNLIRKYDQALRRRAALRPVWLPGTEVQPGDILQLKDGALLSVGNLKDENISYEVSSIGEAQSLNLQSRGVFQVLTQNGIRVSTEKLDVSLEAELTITFNEENSYYLRTPAMSGQGISQALSIARCIAKIPTWDHLKYYVVHHVWRAEDFVFLGNIDSKSEIAFKGKGELIKNLITNGVSSGLSISGGHSMNLEVMGRSGPIVMQVFRVKRNGEIF